MSVLTKQLSSLVGSFLPVVFGNNENAEALEEGFTVVDELSVILEKGEAFVGQSIDCLKVVSAIDIYLQYSTGMQELYIYCMSYARSTYESLLSELAAYTAMLEVSELHNVIRVGHWHLLVGIQFCLPWFCDYIESVRDKVEKLEVSEIRDMTLNTLTYLDEMVAAGFVEAELSVEYIKGRDMTIGFIEASSQMVDKPSKMLMLDYSYGELKADELIRGASFMFSKEGGELGWVD